MSTSLLPHQPITPKVPIRAIYFHSKHALSYNSATFCYAIKTLRRQIWVGAWGLSWVSINIRMQHFDDCSLLRPMRERLLNGWSILVVAIGHRQMCNLYWVHKPHAN